MSTSKTTSPIVDLLVKNGTISAKQVEHARRVQQKLSSFTPLLKVLKDQEVVNDQEIKETIKQATHSIRIGDLLVELGYISTDDVDAAIGIQKNSDTRDKLGAILVKHNFIPEKLLREVLSIQMGFPLVQPNLAAIDRTLCQRVPTKIMQAHTFIPFVKNEDGSVKVAFADPLDQEAIDIAQNYLSARVQPAIAQRDMINKTVELLVDKLSHTSIAKDTKTVVGTVNSIIVAAVEQYASDIHIEPLSDRLQIRFRIDGILEHYQDLPLQMAPALSSRIKVLCDADIAERRRHQGGRILFKYDDGELDLRVSIYITVHGEKIVLRLLNRKQELLDIQSIGLAPRMLARFLDEAVYQTSGVLLVTGPTGSGKTSTVYSCIHNLKSPQVSIVTAEEPVEYVIDGISQCSIDPKINLTFEETLRHIVRQDPDIIVIGEIRDTYSAEIAVQAALTGHKVLSTFHTEDSIGGLVRLLNMDIAPFLVSSTVVSVLAQRLLRRVCPKCAVDVQLTPMQLQRLRCTPADVQGARFKKGRGCSECKHTGYKGRIGVFELLVLDEVVRNAILDQKTSHEIRNLSIQHSGLMTLLEDGMVKAGDGITTIEEVLRCLPLLQAPRPLMELRRLSGI